MEGVNDPEDWSPCSGCLFYKHLDDTNFNVTYCIPCAALHIVSSCFSILRTVSGAPKLFDLRSLFRPTILASATRSPSGSRSRAFPCPFSTTESIKAPGPEADGHFGFKPWSPSRGCAVSAGGGAPTSKIQKKRFLFFVSYILFFQKIKLS